MDELAILIHDAMRCSELTNDDAFWREELNYLLACWLEATGGSEVIIKQIKES